MKATTKTIIELTPKELEAVRDFIAILNDNESLNPQDIWDITKSIFYEDDKTLGEYGYFLDIK